MTKNHPLCFAPSIYENSLHHSRPFESFPLPHSMFEKVEFQLLLIRQLCTQVQTIFSLDLGHLNTDSTNFFNVLVDGAKIGFFSSHKRFDVLRPLPVHSEEVEVAFV